MRGRGSRRATSWSPPATRCGLCSESTTSPSPAARIARSSSTRPATVTDTASAKAQRAGSTVERARINVQRRLRDAIGRIAAEDAALGRYLEKAIETGVFCCFRP